MWVYITTLYSVENNKLELPQWGPKAAGAEPVAAISKARAAVLERLRASDGALSVEKLAAGTGQHTNTVREHLEALVASGFAACTTAPSTGRGRPAKLYSATPGEMRPTGYAALAAALASHIAATSKDPAGAGDLAGRQWAHAMTLPGSVQAHVPGAAGAHQARHRVVSALQDAGFGVQGDADATELTLTTCPILAAARENPEVVCAVHLGLVKGLLEGSGILESDVELVPFSGPGRCSLHLPAVPTP